MTTARVRIIQLLCPSRHCIVACPYVSETGEADPGKIEEMKTAWARMCTEGFNNWCGLCQSSNLHYEDSKTAFRTMEEATPFLVANHEEQMKTREFLRRGKN